MTKTTTRFAALALSALMTLGVVGSVSSLANAQYAKADSLAMAPYGQAHVALQRVTVVGHRVNA